MSHRPTWPQIPTLKKTIEIHNHSDFSVLSNELIECWNKDVVVISFGDLFVCPNYEDIAF